MSYNTYHNTYWPQHLLTTTPTAYRDRSSYADEGRPNKQIGLEGTSVGLPYRWLMGTITLFPLPTQSPSRGKAIRRKIYVGDEEAHRLVRLYLSIFSIGRLVKLAKPVSRNTYSNITDVPKDMESVRMTVEKMKCVLPQIIRRYLPHLSAIPLHQGVTWDILSKSYPNSTYLKFP